mgnify:CR=1 FL=1
MENQGEIILYQPDKEVKLEVRLENETVWLNRQQLAELFARDVKTIGKHINNALKEELADMATVAKFAIVQSEYSTIDLYSYGILACTPKLLNFEVQLEPFEE